MSKQTDLINVTDAITVSGSNVGIGTSSPANTTGSCVDASGPMLARGYLNAHQTSAAVLEHIGDTSKIRSYGTTAGSGAIAFNTGGGGGSVDTERMRIDSSGRVTMPYQPSFQAWSNSGGNEHFAGGTNPSFLTISSNVGNHFNGTTFTAPVSGRYLFFYTILSGTSGDYGLIALNVNGGPAVGTQNWTQHYTTTTNDQQNSGQQILTLSANDQVNLYIHPSHNRFYWNNAYSKFGGHLIG